MDGHHLYCIAIGQPGQDVDQQAQRRGRQFHLMSLFVVIKDLDVLRLELGCEVSRQGVDPGRLP